MDTFFMFNHKPKSKMKRKQISAFEAKGAYRQVCKLLGVKPEKNIRKQGDPGPVPSGPILYRDFEGWYAVYPWAIVWEGGPYEWAVEASFKEELLGGKFLFEPINSYALTFNNI